MLNLGTLTSSVVTNNGQVIFNGGTLAGELINAGSSTMNVGTLATITGGLYQASSVPLTIAAGQSLVASGSFSTPTSHAPGVFTTLDSDGAMNIAGTVTVNGYLGVAGATREASPRPAATSLLRDISMWA